MNRRSARWWSTGAAVLAAVPVVVAAAHLAGADWRPVGDRALIELLTGDVGTDRTPLVGPFSRYGWNHPGPLLFWALAGPYRLAGADAGAMLVAAATVNVAAVAGIVTAAHRRGGPALATAAALATTVLVGVGGPALAADPWNPYVTLLPFLAALVLVWDAGEGSRWALPAAALATSFTVQSHVGYALPLVAALAWSAGVLVVRTRRGHRIGGLRRWWGPLAATTLVVVGCWAPVAVDEVRAEEGNVGQIVSWFGSNDEPTTGVGDAAVIVGRHLGTGAPWLGGDEPTDLFSGSVLGDGGLPAPVPLLAVAACGPVAVVTRRRSGRGGGGAERDGDPARDGAPDHDGAPGTTAAAAPAPAGGAVDGRRAVPLPAALAALVDLDPPPAAPAPTSIPTGPAPGADVAAGPSPTGPASRHPATDGAPPPAVPGVERSGERTASAWRLVAFSLVQVLVAVLAVSRIAGGAFTYLVRWVWVVGALVWLAAAWLVARALVDAWRGWRPTAPSGMPGGAADRGSARRGAATRWGRVVALVPVSVALVVSSIAATGDATEAEAADTAWVPVLEALAPPAAAQLAPGEPVLLRQAGPGFGELWLGTVLVLEQAGIPVRVDPELEHMLGADRATGSAGTAATLVVASGDAAIDELLARPDAIVLSEHDPLTDAERAELARLRTEAVAALEAAGRADLVPSVTSGALVFVGGLAPGVVEQATVDRILELDQRGVHAAIVRLPAGT